MPHVAKHGLKGKEEEEAQDEDIEGGGATT